MSVFDYRKEDWSGGRVPVTEENSWRWSWCT